MKERKPLIIISGEIKTPPFSQEARIEVGVLLGILKKTSEQLQGVFWSCVKNGWRNMTGMLEVKFNDKYEKEESLGICQL